MTGTVTVTVEIESELADKLRAAVAEDEASSVSELVARIMMDWSQARRAGSSEDDRWARRGVEESVADSHPGFEIDDAFAQARATLLRPQSKAS
jgi:Arc/MetJ-type ribon-helix-helix transcriptional regulator